MKGERDGVNDGVVIGCIYLVVFINVMGVVCDGWLVFVIVIVRLIVSEWVDGLCDVEF